MTAEDIVSIETKAIPRTDSSTSASMAAVSVPFNSGVAPWSGGTTAMSRQCSAPVRVPQPKSSPEDRLRHATSRAVEEACRYETHLINTSRRLEGALENSDSDSDASSSDGGASYRKLCNLLNVQKYTNFERGTLGLVSSLASSCVAAGTCVVDVDLLGRKLRGRGYQVWVRQAVGGGNEWFKQLRHSFLLVEGDPAFPDQLYIIDPNFRDQFVIARTTSHYNKVMEAVPRIFLGRGKRLLTVVQLLSAEISTAFTEQGLETPPWRKKKSMLSKWMPDKKNDYVPTRFVEVETSPEQ